MLNSATSIKTSQQHSDTPQCPICHRPLSKEAINMWTTLADIKPKFIQLLERDFKHAAKGLQNPSARVCNEHIQRVLQNRIEGVLEENSKQYSRLQEDAMKNLERYEIEERTWMDQFETKRTIGQIAADGVATFGGSWGFLFSLGGFLIAWTS
eukprot:jgi/Hompol1/6074/HPOL_002755-RA